MMFEMAQTQVPLFEYDNLARDEIRVLTLLPGNDADPIRCEFKSLKRTAAASTFSALSYLWGPEPQDYETIIVGGCRLPIRPSLHDALVALRRASLEKQRLWVDALCINQFSPEEKKHQIRQMGQIYTCASSVTVWLGKAAGDSDYVMDTISAGRSAEYTTRRFMTAMIAIFNRPWFTRTWVVQEFVLNRKPPVIACGFNKPLISWTDFNDAYVTAFPQAANAEIALLPDPHRFEMLPLLDSWLEIHRVYRTFESFRAGIQSASPERPTYALHSALYATRIFQATDPRDKVYGVLGMTNPESQAHIDPNYAKSVDEVFHDATLYILCHEATPAVYTFLPLDRSARPGLPSWVPDFANLAAGRYMGVPSLVDKGEDLRHSGAEVRVSERGRRLMVRGVVLDVVEEAVKPPARQQPTGLEGVEVYLDGRLREVMDAVREWMRGQGLVEEAMGEEAAKFLGAMVYMIELSKAVDQMESMARSCTESWAEGFPTRSLRHMLVIGQDVQSGGDETMQVLFDQLLGAMRELTATIDMVDWRLRINDIALLLNLISNGLSRCGNMPSSLDPGRRFFAGHGGWYGVAEGDVKAGDQLAILFPGANVPFILRETNGDCYEMIGVARLPPGRLAMEIKSGRVGEFREITIE
ncbi:heterokaryon incompatibility protein-domain-containing protein [Lasiosphaeris hirsuta]|uniref:Heterokaryon incompatibility protein-domain-containing protein n=1 Tax=Lasiosphaeris hirsuta TaxID=260670 RepID=A0AA40DGM7_9PEZI|nr:heterokaryon incompatibility protein-domain-containing protein [Lasiosphaeris hirsuta]